jgi:peptidylprolyl isomerase
MLPKKERRALGKAAAAKRAAQRRRKQRLNRIARIAVPFALVLLVVGGIWYLARGNDSTTPAASPQPTAEATGFVLPPNADPQLNTRPVVGAGTGELTELKKTTLIAGTGPAIANGQSITVNYVGVGYATGAQFDSSWNTDKPFTFTLGQGGVIQGWDQGLVGVTVGSRVQLDIPKALAYPNGGGPEGDLRFVVDVLKAE